MSNTLTIILGFHNKLPHSSQVVDLSSHYLTPKQSVEAYTDYVKEGLESDCVTVLTNSPDFVNTIRYLVYQHKIDHQSVVIQYQENYMSEKHIIFLDGNGRYINEDGVRIGFPSGFFDASLSMLIEMGG